MGEQDAKPSASEDVAAKRIKVCEDAAADADAAAGTPSAEAEQSREADVADHSAEESDSKKEKQRGETIYVWLNCNNEIPILIKLRMI